MSEPVDRYEKLGVFYLGRRHDLASGETSQEPILYDSKDLTTHGVCVGMTGSGKTGLGIVMLEEAALDGIPVIAIDPKGDLGNLLLTFPDLRPADFRPWIDEGSAARKGLSADEHAAGTAKLWKKGLADWDQGPERIARYASASERVIYTPGSRSGRPISVLSSFEAPPAAVAADDDALRDRVMSATSGLLGLLGIKGDPIRSRDHILISNLFDRAWREGRSLDLPSLIHQIQSPPIERIGVLDLESFFPSRERFELAMTLNNLLASPSFSAWAEGEPLNVGKLLYTDDGRPKLSVLSIAHLSESERMFFVTLLLGEVITWMRAQPGTQGLRALLYMDEVFGYFPPTANPPSKLPMLTLMKQARAYGLGVILATQNPVDLDYKGLSNAGTWLIGRLQTERDKLRVLEGLEGAAVSSGSGFNRASMEQTLAGLGDRAFLMHNVHEDEPVVFKTRWALSYLAGPLTRTQLKKLGSDDAAPTTHSAPGATNLAAGSSATARLAARKARKEEAGGKRPIVPPEIEQAFLPVSQPAGPGERLVYRPTLLASATLHYAKANVVDEWRNRALMAEATGANPWTGAQLLGASLPDLDAEPEEGIAFEALPRGFGSAKAWSRLGKQLATQLYRDARFSMWRSKKPKLVSTPEESEGEFRGRLREAERAARDLKIEKLRKRYAPKLATLQDRIRYAERRLETEAEQYQSSKLQSAISIGASVLGALFGRKLASVGNVGRATTAARSIGRASRERGDISRAEERVEVLAEQLATLEASCEDDLAELEVEIVVEDLDLEQLEIAPRKSDISVERLLLAWVPWRIDARGQATPATTT